MVRSKSLILFVCLSLAASLAFGQVETQLTKKKALLGVTNPVIQGTRILVGEDSNVAVSDVVILDVRTDYKFSRVRARQNGQRVEPERLAENSYLFAGAGSYVVEVTVFDPEKGIDDAELTFQIGNQPKPPEPQPEPEPDPQPVPDEVPNDYGVGLLTFRESPADAVNAKRFAEAYRAGAGKLFGAGGNLASIDRVLADISSTVANRQCADQSKCEQWGRWKTKLDAAIKAEQARRGSFSRQDWFLALSEIATALEAKNER